MTFNQRMNRAIAYFTVEEHSAPFELLSGKGKVFLSAPHATAQTRNGAVKSAERYTGALCFMLHEQLNCPVIYKSRHLLDDANHDPVSDYRDAVCDYIHKNDIACLLDLHQLSPARPMALCICTGKQRNLCGRTDMVGVIKQCFLDHGISRITVDDPFDGGSPHTVSSTVAVRRGIPAVQLELNTRLLMSGYEETCFQRCWPHWMLW
ncbi:MAG: hypothetical protein FWF86_00860 [Clostridia bacterium]|nr:hypothetical protein [Clostridia bacterium]